jgi:hypothetical protein
MNEALDAFLDLNEGTVRHQADNFAFDSLTDREALFNPIPWIGLHLFHSQGDALFVAVDIKNLDFDVLTDLQHFPWMGQPCPRHVGDMQETVDAVQIDEGPEIGDILYRSTNPIADVDAAQESLPLFRALLLDDLSPTWTTFCALR